MINEENLNKIYNGLIENKELTTKELNSYGFNSKDLSNLIKDGILKRTKRGYYSFLSIDDLYYYGKQLIALKEYNKATACFEKCHELNPEHKGTCFQLFLRAVQAKDYEKAFNYFEYFYNSDNEYYNNDSNFYLYLLSMITEIPEKYREYVKYLRLEDIKIDFNDKRYENPYSQNKVRISSLNKKFFLAKTQLDELIKQHGKITVQDIIVMTLLNQAAKKQNIFKKNIVNLIKEKKYEEIESILIHNYHYLSEADDYVLFLTREILNFKNTGIIPKIEVTSTNKLFEAIDGKNYELALALSKDFIETNNINPNSNAIYMLLKEITELMKTKSNQSIKIQEQPVNVPIKKAEIESTIKPSNSMTSNITFATVIGYLMQQDFDNSFKALRGYLKGIDKSEYEFLIIDLIKISLIEKDMAFSKPMVALTYISRENFTFDISEYIQNFYESLAQNRFAEARIYLDIIAGANKLGQNCILTESLEQVLNNTEKMLNYTRNNKTLDRVDSSLKMMENEPTIQVPTQQTIIRLETQQSVGNDPLFVDNKTVAIPIEESTETFVSESFSKTPTKKFDPKSITTNYDDSKFIQGKLNELYEKGIILLKPMNDSRRKNIHNIVNGIPDVESFSITSDAGRQIVLIFKPNIVEYRDLIELAKKGDNAYNEGKYDSCIDCYKQLLLEYSEPKSWVYAKLGLAYMKKFDKSTAIDYLTIATSLAKEQHRNFDFTELIASLKGLIDSKDKKPRIRMSTKDFGNDTENYYGIENIYDILELINSGVNIDESCAKFGLNEEKKAIVTLIIAREYYMQGNYSTGDLYLKKVEKAKNKTKLIISLLDEIRKNKLFYINRVPKGHNDLILSLRKPK